MANLLIHFVFGTAGALIIFLAFTRLTGSDSFSAPFGVVFIGINCVSLAHFASPWATPIVLGIYALANGLEVVQERRRASNVRR